jgi:phage-related protein
MKVVRWMGSSLKDVRSFPESVRKEIGRALFTVQMGGVDLAAKPLQGFGGAGVVEIVASFRSDTYRAVYTVRFGTRCTSCTRSRRNPSVALPRRSRTGS